ncbi:MAG: hypothetical protein LBL51_03950 [Synergistaceae bacterium]|jgi:hypothetical protein|nr:hypothetical protein [Synergistaceae bacterium]
MKKREGHALCWTMLLVFTASALLGAFFAHAARSSEVAAVFVRRAQARSQLLSLTNLSWKWLRAELGAGGEAAAVSAEALRVFVSSDLQGGTAEVFDLSYDPRDVPKFLSDPLLFPPSYPGGYLIRATVTKPGLAPLMMESVFALVSVDVPGVGMDFVLEEKPVLQRELTR